MLFPVDNYDDDVSITLYLKSKFNIDLISEDTRLQRMQRG
jgi:hypothetical protein